MENTFPPSLSRKIYNGNGNGNGFAAKSLYDDVFGVRTLSPRVEDYGEIFGGFNKASRGSSIPVLDLPAVDEADVCFDVRSSKFDYSEVFGGFNGFDFAVPYEDLLDQVKPGDDFLSSSEEAWTPVGSESLSEDSDFLSYSDQNQSSLNGDCHESFDGVKQFNISYQKANQRSKEDMSNGTHITQIHAVPEFTCVLDEISPLQKAGYENPPLQVASDCNLSVDLNGGKIGGKHLRKTMSHPPNSSAHTFGKDLESRRGQVQNVSRPNEMFVTISEVSLRTQPSELPPPSRPPPLVDVRKGDSSEFSLKFKATRSYSFEGSAGDSSPTFFDVEVDASSSAAASAAAMKEAMEKAQAQLKSAKESMERKKEGLQSRAKMGSKNSLKDKVAAKASKFVDGFNSLEDQRVQGACDKGDGRMKFSVGQERQKVLKTSKPASDSVEGERLLDVDKKPAEGRNVKESWSSLESYKTDGAGEWKEATQYFELVRTDKSRMVPEQANNDKVLLQSVKAEEHGQREKKAAMEGFMQQEENDQKMNTAVEAREKEENEKAVEEAHWQEECEKIEVAGGVWKHGKEKKLRAVHEHEKTEKKLLRVDEWEEHEVLFEVQHKENEVKFKEALKCKENEQKLKEDERMEQNKTFKGASEREENERLKETFELEEYGIRLKEAPEKAENEKRLKQALQKEEKEKQLKEAHEMEESKKTPKEAFEQEEKEKRLKEAFEEEENEKNQQEAREREENKKKPKEALEQEENKKRTKEAFEKEENEKKQKEAHEREENEKRLREACEREENDRKIREAREKEENEKKIREAFEREDTEKRLKEAREQEENNKRLNKAFEIEGNEMRMKGAVKQEEIEESSRQDYRWEESESGFKEPAEGEELSGISKAQEECLRDESEKKLKVAQGTYVQMEEENFRASDEECKQDEAKNLDSAQMACKLEENGVMKEVTPEVLADKDNENLRTKPRDGENEVEAVEMASELVDERSKASGMAQGDLQHEETWLRVENAIKSVLLDEKLEKSGETVTGVGQTHAKEDMDASQIVADLENMQKKLAHEGGEKGKNIKQAQVAFDQEENKDKFIPSQVVKEGVEFGRKIEAVQSAKLEGKGNILKTASQASTGQSTERKDRKLNETLTPEEREKEEKMKRERELEMDWLRKMEEEREREREREKDRMAVDRATREARERAYAEACERAERAAVERATAEARQRAMIEARERLEKACAEAREKSLAEKTSMEARLRAERAAVEKATAEARERAFEKAMRQGSSSSDLPDLQSQSTGPSSVSRYPYSSVYGASYNLEKFERIEGESVQRCKARLERHRRTAERAAKALAEKNMRDLLAQREQAERNRLAESLDADVKRWSSGKEGNLRALLSTLQYILGPDSGWQPIPLTDVITSAAVKKAYRKATLCVHPDKLQQRGASIQQKYICEKVFDLLKEAWNKFNSEER